MLLVFLILRFCFIVFRRVGIFFSLACVLFLASCAVEILNKVVSRHLKEGLNVYRKRYLSITVKCMNYRKSKTHIFVCSCFAARC